jgi:hypothetical protein
MVIVYELLKDPLRQRHILGVPTMETKVDEKGNFELKKIEYHSENNLIQDYL